MMTGLVIYSATIWYTTTYVAESMQARIQHEYERHLLNSVSQWGVQFSQKYYEEIIKQLRSVDMGTQIVQENKDKEYQISLYLVPVENSIRVQTKVVTPSKKNVSHSCLVTRKIIDEKPVFVVT
jgi:hypothetical protein